MLYTLAALASVVAFPTNNTCFLLQTPDSPQQQSFSTTIIPSEPSPVAAVTLQEAQSISAALIESLLTVSTATPALAQGGNKPSLETTPASPDEQPFQPTNVPLEPLQRTDRKARSAPGIAVLTPSAYGQSWGSASIGLGLQSRTRFSNKADGVLGLGIGLGDARNSVGIDIGLTFVDLIGNTAQDGTLSLKLHRRLPNDFAIAAGIKNLIRFGATDSETGYYGVVTKRFQLQESVEKPFSQLFVSVGLGSGQFRSELDINNNRDSVGIFASAAVRMAEPVSAIAEWSGQDLTLGLSLVPFPETPLVVTPALTDITGNAGDGSRFILGIGYALSF